MAMNRQQKRLLQKQGEIDDSGEPIRGPRKQASSGPPQERTGFVRFFREVRNELRKVAWPSRSETINYSIVVLITVIILGLFIYGLDWLFSVLILDLFAN